jgi:uridine kinase
MSDRRLGLTPSDREAVLAELAERILSVNVAHPTRVAVDGPDMAGKTVLADELRDRIRDTGRDVIRASIDDFHRPRRERYGRGSGVPEGYYHDSFDLEQFQRVLLMPLGPGGNRTFATAVFDVRRDAPVRQESRVAQERAVLLVDGLFLLRPELRPHWDFSIFVWASVRERLARSMVRDLDAAVSAEELERLYWSRYAPGQELYLRTVAPQALADVSINNERPLAPGLAYRSENR